MNVARLLSALVGACVSVLVLIYVAVHFVSGYGDTIETSFVSQITVEDKLEAQCYMLRHEAYVTSNVSGVLYYTVNDGERVRKNQTVADVFGSENDIALQKQIEQIDRRIEILEESAVSHGYVTVSISKMDDDITNTILSVNRNIAQEEYVRAFSFSDHLLTSLNKRHLVINRESGYDAQISRLEGEKQMLMGRLSQAAAYVNTQYSGFFSTDIDGYENILIPGVLDTVNVDGFFDILSNSERTPANVVGKVITDYEWNIVALVDKKTAGDFAEGKTYDLYFPYSNNSRISSCYLEKKVIQTSSDTVLLSFSASEIPEGFSYMREQLIEIVRSSVSGIRIPKTALRVVNGETGVYILSANTVYFKKIEILYTSESFYLVSGTDESNPLGIYDKVIAKGKDLYDGKVIS